MDIGTWLEMGGYAAWVWPGYGLVAIAMIGLVVVTLSSLRARERAFAALRRDRRGAPGNDLGSETSP